MNEFNQYNNVAIMSAIQEFYEVREKAKAAKLTSPEAPARQPATGLVGALSTLRRIATTPLPLPWRRAAA